MSAMTASVGFGHSLRHGEALVFGVASRGGQVVDVGDIHVTPVDLEQLLADLEDWGLRMAFSASIACGGPVWM